MRSVRSVRQLLNDLLIGFGIGAGVFVLAWLVVVFVALPLMDPAVCCVGGCAWCEELWRRCRRNRRWARRALAVACVVASWALLASAVSGCERVAVAPCPAGWHAERLNCREVDCSIPVITVDGQGNVTTNMIWDTCERCDDACVSPDGKVAPR